VHNRCNCHVFVAFYGQKANNYKKIVVADVLGAEVAQSGGRQAAVPSGTVQVSICDTHNICYAVTKLAHLPPISYPYLSG